MSAASKAHTDGLVADLEHDLSIMRTSRELYSAKAITRHEEIVSRLKMHSQLVEALKHFAEFPLEDFGWDDKPDDHPVTGFNSWKLTVGHIRKARLTLSHLTKA